MSKREIPEINAGSMADIAFLLLIFFLVTTTMDKDAGYLRQIPKKLDIEMEKPPKVEEKNIYEIKINDRQEMFVRDSILPVEEIDNLHRRIKHFFLANRGKSAGERKLNYPYYANITRQVIDGGLAQVNAEIERIEAEMERDPSDYWGQYYELQMNKLSEWEKKQRAFDLYSESGATIMPEIAREAHIRIVPQIATDYSAFIAIQSEIQRAITEMRDEESMKLFNIKYSTMEKFYEQNKNEDMPTILPLYKERLELLKILFPEKIIEVAPKN
ncbi:Biopolymer transport protein ExbD/TolR [Lishizhenia tianjinensis]|uniref:Biopolymer transport protein ExbD/TolR n=1 Tax=Lishizhenia tianjinensis TaxID=477690 RepID=A0A1I6ZIR5_9FLAO|nr:biopolymer transporter ExbD [Lishizhenia tianjinensis]SFT62589.1 Biopolymer transport protein ExbD/TolR [Lishizhenia tianjinensis]